MNDQLTGETRSDEFDIEATVTAQCAVMIPSASPKPPLLVVLHGWGQRAKMFLRTFRPLARQGWLVAAPQAPHPFYVDRERGKIGYSWLTREHRDAAIRDTNAYLCRTLDALAERHAYDEGRICFLGFSQGSSVAHRFLQAHPGRVTAIASCCADLPPDVRETFVSLPPRPAFVAYCPTDPIVPAGVSREAVMLLGKYGWPTTEFRFDEGHRITPGLVSRLGRWLMEALPPDAPT